MGTYGTATGVIQGVHPASGEPIWLMLVDGEVVGSFTEAGGVVATRGELAGMALTTTPMIRERSIDFALAESAARVAITVGDFVYIALGQINPPAIMRVAASSGEKSTAYFYELSGFNAIEGLAANDEYLFVLMDGGSDEETAQLAQIELASLRLVRSIPVGEWSGEDVVIAPDGLHLYVRTREGGAPATYTLSKIEVASFAVVDELVIGHGSASGKLAINDTHLFCSSWYPPGAVVRVDLSDFSSSVALNFTFGGDQPGAMALNATHLYVASTVTPGRVLRVNLDDFSTVAELTLSSGYSLPSALAIDDDYLVVTCSSSPARVARIALADFSTKIETAFASDYVGARAAVLTRDYWGLALDDTAGLGSAAGFARIPRADFDAGAALLTIFADGGRSPEAVVVSGGYLYAGLNQSHTVGDTLVARISLLDDSRIDLLATGVANKSANCLLALDGFLYVGNSANPAKITKIDLAAWSVVTTLTASSGADYPMQMVASGGYLYVLCYAGKVVKIDLATFTETGTFTAASEIMTMACDGTYLYVSSALDEPGQITRVALSDFSTNTTLVLSAGAMVGGMVVSGAYLYAGINGVPGYIYKIARSTFTETAVMSLDQPYVDDLVADGNDLFAASSSDPATVSRVDLTSFTEVAAVLLDATEGYATTSLCKNGSFLYAGTNHGQVVIVKIDSPSLQPATGEGFALLDENGDPAISYNADDVLTLGSARLKMLLNARNILIKAPVTVRGDVAVDGGISAKTVGGDVLTARQGLRLESGVADMGGHRLLDAVLDLPVLAADPTAPVNGEVWLYAAPTVTRIVAQGLPFLHRKAVVGAAGAPELRAYINAAAYKVALTAI